MKKKVFISAYAYINVGDDLFIKILCERYPWIDFIMISSSKYKTIFKEISNLKIIPSDTLYYRIFNKACRLFNKEWYILNYYLTKCIAFVFIGGSLFIEDKNWKNRIEFTNKKLFEKPIFLLGANFGPYDDKNFYYEFKRVFSKYNDICFRDNYSYQLFKEIGNIRVSPDIIFSLNINSKELSKKNNVFISVINLEEREKLKDYTDKYEKKIAEICNFFASKEITVNIASFCSIEKDDKSINRIINLVNENVLDNINCINYDGNLDEIISKISNSRLVIASRFHAMILGWILNSNVIPLIYSTKTSNIIKDVNFKGLQCEIEKIDSLKIDEIYTEYKKNTVFSIDKYKKQAEQQFEKLDTFLKNRFD